MANRITALRTSGGEDVIPQQTVTIIGIGESGFRELGARAQQAIYGAQLILGTWRQLGSLPDDVQADKRPYTTVNQIAEIFRDYSASRIVVLDQGDPSFFGVAEQVSRVARNAHISVIPHVSAPSLACARLGLRLEETEVYSVWSDDVSHLVVGLDKGRPFFVLAKDETTINQIASLLCSKGYEDAVLVSLCDLGGPAESITYGSATEPPEVNSELCVVAVITLRNGQSLLPGLSDHNYSHVHNSKHVRALSICALRPRDTDTMWSIGGGAIAIEFLRATSHSRAICFEESGGLQDLMLADAYRLGVADRIAIQHKAPDAFDDVPDAPDVIFIGEDGLSILERAWQRLRPGGRLVLNGDESLVSLTRTYGGSVDRFVIDNLQGDSQEFYQLVVTKPEGI